MKIDVLGLQAFLGIAEHGSFQRAAASLNITSTALSHRLRKVEDDLGVRLIWRTTRRVTLTPAGSEFLGEARRMLDELAACYEALRERGKKKQEILAFGCLPTLALNLVPEVVTKFARANPDVKVKIADRVAPDLCDLVKSGTIEFALTVGTAIEPQLELKQLANVRMMVFCPKDHPLASKRMITPTDLEGAPLIHLSSRDGARMQIESAFGSRGNSLNWICEVHQSATAIRLVAAGAGLTVSTQFAADVSRDHDVVAIPLTHPRLTNALGILIRKDASLSPAADSMVKLLRETVRERYARKKKK